MLNLSTYVAGGAIFALAMDWAGASVGTQFNRFQVSSLDLAPAAMTVVNRGDKGDRLQMADAPMVERVVATTIITKTVNPSIATRDKPSGTKNDVALRLKGDRESLPNVPASPGTQTSSGNQNTTIRSRVIPEGCDPAFSPLVGGKRNYAARCLS